ncbi:hypothetical protein [Shimia thalassica]|uniref:hypothetical protein n=1 Tax=Shimia thalassica TaxID=1715693 RepID=UPI0024941F1D|nr:hypothetical protein [Shimia thalassica]
MPSPDIHGCSWNCPILLRLQEVLAQLWAATKHFLLDCGDLVRFSEFCDHTQKISDHKNAARTHSKESIQENFMDIRILRCFQRLRKVTLTSCRELAKTKGAVQVCVSDRLHLVGLGGTSIADLRSMVSPIQNADIAKKEKKAVGR